VAKASNDYLEKLRARAKESRVYRKYQLDGLEIAQLLDDEKHKALYIKLAKERDPDKLRAIARDVADNPAIRNKGAYFMTRLANKPNRTVERNNNRKNAPRNGKRIIRRKR